MSKRQFPWTHFWLQAAALSLVLSAAGCSKGPEGATVTGTVYLDGQPLADAVIRLWPKDDLNLGVYGGKTDATGTIELRLQGGKLVKPGKYVVLVAKQVPRKQTARHPTEEEQITILSGPDGFRNFLPALYSDKERC